MDLRSGHTVNAIPADFRLADNVIHSDHQSFHLSLPADHLSRFRQITCRRFRSNILTVSAVTLRIRVLWYWLRKQM